MAKHRDTDPAAMVTFFMFCAGCGVLGAVAGFGLAVAVFLIGYSVVGEVQRKSNDVIDAIEKRDA